MAKYSVTIAANVRAYATVEIEAADGEAAWRRVEAIIDSPEIWSEPEFAGAYFQPEFDTLDDFSALFDLTPVEASDGEIAA